MSNLDEVIHQSTRLRIMTALHLLKKDEWIEFVRLKSLITASDGNLGAHLDTLSRANYAEIDKQIVGKKPLTRIRATPEGRAAYRRHLNELRTLLGM
jgi:DNA-binding PadR family transcriptional regulator